MQKKVKYTHNGSKFFTLHSSFFIKCRTFAPAFVNKALWAGPFVYRLGREIFIL